MENSIENENQMKQLQMGKDIEKLVRECINNALSGKEEDIEKSVASLTFFGFTHYVALTEFMTDCIVNTVKLNEISRRVKTSKLPYIDVDKIIEVINVDSQQEIEQIPAYKHICSIYANRLNNILKGPDDRVVPY